MSFPPFLTLKFEKRKIAVHSGLCVGWKEWLLVKRIGDIRTQWARWLCLDWYPYPVLYHHFPPVCVIRKLAGRHQTINRLLCWSLLYPHGLLYCSKFVTFYLVVTRVGQSVRIAPFFGGIFWLVSYTEHRAATHSRKIDESQLYCYKQTYYIVSRLGYYSLRRKVSGLLFNIYLNDWLILVPIHSSD